jgi:hypothetical protein
MQAKSFPMPTAFFLAGNDAKLIHKINDIDRCTHTNLHMWRWRDMLSGAATVLLHAGRLLGPQQMGIVTGHHVHSSQKLGYIHPD